MQAWSSQHQPTSTKAVGQGAACPQPLFCCYEIKDSCILLSLIYSAPGAQPCPRPPHCIPPHGSSQHCAEHQVHVCCSRDSLTEVFIVNVQIGSCCSKERVAAALPALQIILPSEQPMQTSRSSAAPTAAPAPCSALLCK